MNEQIRRLFLPYVIKQVEPGRYVFLNRYHKPLGMPNGPSVNYRDHMVKVRISKAQARKMSFTGSEDRTCIVLYNDGCLPTSSQFHWEAYAKRLQVLANLKCDAEANKPI